MPGEQTLAAQVRDIDRIEREMKQQVPEVRWSFFEPDTAPVEG